MKEKNPNISTNAGTSKT